MVRYTSLTKATALVVLTALLLPVVSGCFRMQLETKQLDQSVYLSSKTPKTYTRLKDFTVNTNGSWAIFGLVTLNTPELSSILKDEITRQQGDAVINLTIQSQTTFTDGLIGFIALLGLIYQPRTVIVTGTVVSFDKTSSLRLSPSADFMYSRQSNGVVYRTEEIVNEQTKFNF